MKDKYTFGVPSSTGWGDYRACCYKNGKRYPDGDVFGPSLQDVRDDVAAIELMYATSK